MTDYYRFPDTALTVARLLGQQFATPERAGIRTPADLESRLPFIRVTRAGGPADQVNDTARLAVDVFARDYTIGEALAQRIMQYLLEGRRRLGPALIDRAVVDVAPQEVEPWAPGVFRFEAQYTVVSRRYRAA